MDSIVRCIQPNQSQPEPKSVAQARWWELPTVPRQNAGARGVAAAIKTNAKLPEHRFNPSCLSSCNSTNKTAGYLEHDDIHSNPRGGAGVHLHQPRAHHLPHQQVHIWRLYRVRASLSHPVRCIASARVAYPKSPSTDDSCHTTLDTWADASMVASTTREILSRMRMGFERTSLEPCKSSKSPSFGIPAATLSPPITGWTEWAQGSRGRRGWPSSPLP